ncbi:MAG: hypothetical protein MI748_02680 [Opitutales bacterium]|nr:hypothetical protein [Opitutales bacterium]
MTPIDYSIVCIYMLIIIIAGVLLQQRAAKNIDTYFLGGRKLPWWVLGSSGMAANVDISGTMINTALIYSLGVMGFYVELRGGVVLILAFLLVFMGKWNRRSGVMTLAEWMYLRFGSGKQGDLARLISAIASIILTIALISYFAIASGKFAGEFLGMDWRLAATLMIIIAASYTVASGLYAVVWIDLMQSAIILGVALFIVFMAMTQVNFPGLDAPLVTSIPALNGETATVQTTYGEWTSIVPKMTLDFEGPYAIFNLFGVAISFYLMKAILEGFGGGNSYMAQRYFAAKDEREAGLISLLWTVLLAFRWPLTGALALFGVHYGIEHAVIADPEMVVPTVINTYLPIGLKGLVIAGFIAAAMSTVDATVNAGASYWVKDIYQAYINPKASEKKLMLQSKLGTILLLLIGLLLSFTVRNINEIWGWTMMGIASGILVPQLMRWYWWRFNGFGFAAGTFTGLIAAIATKLLVPEVQDYTLFIYSSALSFVGCIIGTYLTPATDDEVLSKFYKVTRPFGLWGKFKLELPEQQQRSVRAENQRDIVSIFMAVPWQITLFLSAMMIVYKRWDQFVILGSICALLSVGLYFNWFRHLKAEKADI